MKRHTSLIPVANDIPTSKVEPSSSLSKREVEVSAVRSTAAQDLYGNRKSIRYHQPVYVYCMHQIINIAT